MRQKYIITCISSLNNGDKIVHSLNCDSGEVNALYVDKEVYEKSVNEGEMLTDKNSLIQAVQDLPKAELDFVPFGKGLKLVGFSLYEE